MFNLNQIKNIIKQKILYYCETNGIKVNTDLQINKINNLNNKEVKFDSNAIIKKNKKLKKYNIQNIIPEEDESKFVSGKNSTLTKNSFVTNSFLKNNLCNKKSNLKTSLLNNNEEMNKFDIKIEKLNNNL